MATISTDRMIAAAESNAVDGVVAWSPAKSMWTLVMLGVAVVVGPLTYSHHALLLLLVTTAVTICCGHSVGMHRLLIHRSFSAPKWLERVLVYLGTLVGMAGPFGMIAAHDIRDWAQRQAECHDLYAHRKGFWRDLWWQMHCVVRLDHPPQFLIEDGVQRDEFYRFIDQNYMLQQLPWAVLFYGMGGWGFVVWGIAVRVTLSLHGHWLVGHFAHRRGQQNWAVDGVAVQGYNIPNVSLLTFGEGWHGNHHAYPGSARLGLAKGELDPGWWFVRMLELFGLAWDIKLPETVGDREGLRTVSRRNQRYPKKFSLLSSWLAATVVLYAILEGTSWRSGYFRFELGLLPLLAAITALCFLIAVVPAIRLLSNTAELDAGRSYFYYIGVGALLSVILSLPFLGGAAIVFPLVIVPAIAAALTFAYFNKRAIRRHLALAD